MAKTSPTSEATTTAPAKPKRKPIDRTVKQNVNLLRSISECYRDAASALTSGNTAAYNNALNLATRYQDLITALNESANAAATAAGLEQTAQD